MEHYGDAMIAEYILHVTCYIVMFSLSGCDLAHINSLGDIKTLSLTPYLAQCPAAWRRALWRGTSRRGRSASCWRGSWAPRSARSACCCAPTGMQPLPWTPWFVGRDSLRGSDEGCLHTGFVSDGASRWDGVPRVYVSSCVSTWPAKHHSDIA